MMRTGHQRQIGVLIPKIYSDAVVQVTEGITQYIQKYGYMSVLGVTHADEQKELEYLSSAGLRILLKTQKKMQRQGDMTIKNVQAGVREVLDMTGFSDMLNIEDNAKRKLRISI